MNKTDKVVVLQPDGDNTVAHMSSLEEAVVEENAEIVAADEFIQPQGN